MEYANMGINMGMLAFAFVSAIPVVAHGAVLHAKRLRRRHGRHVKLSPIHRFLLKLADFFFFGFDE